MHSADVWVASMPMKEIEILGLYGAQMRPCSVCDITDLGQKLEREQASEATAAARRDSDAAYDIAAAVFSRFGTDVRIRLTPSDSPRGLWLTPPIFMRTL